jgi:hypothetical protein
LLGLWRAKCPFAPKKGKRYQIAVSDFVWGGGAVNCENYAPRFFKPVLEKMLKNDAF